MAESSLLPTAEGMVYPELEMVVRYAPSASENSMQQQQQRQQQHQAQEQETLVRVACKGDTTVRSFASRVVSALGLPETTADSSSIVFNGIRLDNSSYLAQYGLRCASGAESWAGHRVFHNGWHVISHQKTLFKIMPSWWTGGTESEFPATSARLFGLWPVALLLFSLVLFGALA